MKKYEVEIKGVQPIIWNCMKREIELEKKELKKNEMAEWETLRENWIKKAEYDKNGDVIIPDRWFKSTLIESCKKTRMVPHYATRKSETYSNYVTSFMIFSKGTVCKKDDLEEFGAFVGAQGKNSNTKVWRVRPMLKKWSARFEIIDPAERMKLSELKELIEYSGMLIGLGDNRINNYGRFDLIKLVEIK